MTTLKDGEHLSGLEGHQPFAYVVTEMLLLSLQRCREFPYLQARAMKSPGSQSTSRKSVLILSSHLRLGLPKGLFPSGFPTKTLSAVLDCSVRATCPAHLSRLDLRFLIILGEEYNACKCHYVTFSILCNFVSLGSK